MVVNVFLGTGGKLLADVSIFEVDTFEAVSFLGPDAFLVIDVSIFEVDAFESVSFLAPDAFLGIGAFLSVNFFGIWKPE